MLHILDTAFSNGRGLIVCQFLQESFKVKESSFPEIWNADTAFFYLVGQYYIPGSMSLAMTLLAPASLHAIALAPQPLPISRTDFPLTSPGLSNRYLLEEKIHCQMNVKTLLTIIIKVSHYFRHGNRP